MQTESDQKQVSICQSNISNQPVIRLKLQDIKYVDPNV